MNKAGDMKTKNLNNPKSNNFKYLISGEKDTLWGITVNTVGNLIIEPDYEVYPPLVGHPDAFYFNVAKGRKLDSYQLVYISHGRGKYFTSPKHSIDVHAGDLFILRPNVWHSYYPDRKTGWHEYWIGLKGPNLDSHFKNEFFDGHKIIYNVGFIEEIVDLYNKAISVAMKERATCQQYLAGIANLILGMTIYYYTNRHLNDDIMVKNISKACIIMRENLLTDMTPEQVAEQVCMSYSWFRKMFRDYTGMSPARYMQELKLQRAKNMLVSSTLSIKEIAYTLCYEDASYFSALFKKYLGCSPIQYRNQFGG